QRDSNPCVGLERVSERITEVLEKRPILARGVSCQGLPMSLSVTHSHRLTTSRGHKTGHSLLGIFESAYCWRPQIAFRKTNSSAERLLSNMSTHSTEPGRPSVGRNR